MMKPISKNYLIAGLVAIGIFCAYVGTVRYAHFDGEDWGQLVRASLVKTPGDVYNAFKYGDINPTSEISPESPNGSIAYHEKISFLTCFYRPALTLFYALQFWVFHEKANSYYCCTIALHALVTGAICLLLLHMFSIVPAVLTSCYFGAHPTLWGWLGKFDTSQHQINLLLLSLSCIAALFFLRKKQYRYLILVAIPFVATLLIRETLLVIPLLLLGGVVGFKNELSDQHRKNLAWVFVALAIAVCTYLAIRFCAYPRLNNDFSKVFILLKNGASTNNTDIFSTISAWIINFVHKIYDGFWLQFFPWTTYAFCEKKGILLFYKLLKAAILFSVGYAFFITPHKKKILALLLVASILQWPLYFVPYGGGRFYYEALPAIAIIVSIFLSTLIERCKCLRPVVCTVFAIIIVFNFAENVRSINLLSSLQQKQNIVLQSLKNDIVPHIGNRSIVILNLPASLGLCITQAIQVLNIGITLPITHFPYLEIKNPGHDGCNVAIVHTRDGINFKSLGNNTWFILNELFAKNNSQDFYIYRCDKDRIYDFSLKFKGDKEVAYLLWLPEQNKFLIDEQ